MQDGFVGEEVRLVALEQDHPGFLDPAYRARRDEIARLAGRYVAGGPLSDVAYNDDEQAVWRHVWTKLEPLHAAHACRVYHEGCGSFSFDHQHIPSFKAINARLEPMEGFSLAPVAGLVLPETFLRQLANRRFLATQYMRHPSQPLYTPEPDVVHEYIGHVPMLAHPELAALNLAFGDASMRADESEIEALIRVYWYTIEFGVLQESDVIKVYGAGILSSFGEIERFGEAQLNPWNLGVMAKTSFDPTTYQSQLFVAPPFEQLRVELHAWLDNIGRR
ncbi:MAG: phenylalanine 4-monooxygenase [Myxococcota bacterium]